MKFRPLDAQVIPRFAGIRTFMRLPNVQSLEGVEAAIVGIPLDTSTTYRPGARFGPEAIRSLSSMLRPFHAEYGIDILDALATVDWGDLPIAPGDAVGTYARVEEALQPLIAADIFPLALGGDHSISLPVLRVLARRYGPLGLVHLDAHTDTWDIYFGQKYFHGTGFRRAVEEGLLDPGRCVQAGMRGSLFASSDLEGSRELGLMVVTAEELRGLGPNGYGQLIRERVGDGPTYLSFDVDFLDPAFAPGTGTPEVAGFTTLEAILLLRALRGRYFVGADVVETSPPFDGPGQITALAAANIAWEMLALRAVARPGR
jgi:agmatinase